jgi:hypothetical protein
MPWDRVDGSQKCKLSRYEGLSNSYALYNQAHWTKQVKLTKTGFRQRAWNSENSKESKWSFSSARKKETVDV